MASPAPLTELLHRLRIAQREAWERGERSLVENYLHKHPELASHEDSVLDFIYSEFCLREELGQKPAHSEYIRRFPQWSDRLERLFAVHQGMEDETFHQPSAASNAIQQDDHETTDLSDEVDKRLSGFESQWKLSQIPSIEDYLKLAPKNQANQLFAGLLYLDFKYRKNSGERIQLSSYLTRFPNYPLVLKKVVYQQNDRELESEFEELIKDVKEASRLQQSSMLVESQTTEVTTFRFKEKRFHAAGGVGEVYLAFDETLRRDIALKRLKKEKINQSEAQARFLREAEITGFLEHPGIVPIYHYGTSSDGRPFYLMRFIQGYGIDELLRKYHHDNPTPDISRFNEQLRYFLQILIDVCHTMDYAHHRQVIHRDLKPGNIMVGSSGETLVVDWGMAKVLFNKSPLDISAVPPTHSLSDEHKTHDGQIQGTPAYMSPEQARGELVLGPGTDIFALGAILYQIITGKHPYHDAENRRVSLSRVEKGEYTPLELLQPKTPAALACIVKKAMAKTPHERYLTANLMAEDVQRWLADEPVSVYKDSRYEKITRWMRRNDSRVVTSIVALVLILITAITSFLFVNSARRSEAEQRKQAEKARADAVAYLQREREAVDTWLTSASDVMRYYPGVQHARQQMLAKAAEHYEQFAASDASSDPQLELERGKSYLRLGDVSALRNQIDNADQAFHASEQIFSKLQLDGSNIDAKVGWAQSRLRRALITADQGQITAAKELLKSTLKELAGDDVRLVETRAFCLANQGKLLLQERQLDDSRELLFKSALEFQKLIDQQPDQAKHRYSWAGTTSLLGQVLVDLGLVVEGKAKLDDARKKFEALVKSQPDDPTYLEQLSHTRIALANALRALGERSEEAKQYAAALKDYERLNAALPDVPVFLEGMGYTRIDYAQLLTEAPDLQEAIVQLSAAIPIFARLSDTYPNVPRYREEYAAAADAEGDVLREIGKSEEAETWLNKSLAVLEPLAIEHSEVPVYRERLVISRSRMAQVYETRNDDSTAAEKFRQALTELGDVRNLSEIAQNAKANIHWYLGETLLRLKRNDESKREFETAHEGWMNLVSLEPSNETLANYARFLTHCADTSFRDAKNASKLARQVTNSSPNNLEYLLLLAQTQYRLNETTAGLETIKKIRQEQEPPQARVTLTQALLEWQVGREEEAKKSFTEGERYHSEQHPGRRDSRILLEEARATLQLPQN